MNETTTWDLKARDLATPALKSVQKGFGGVGSTATSAAAAATRALRTIPAAAMQVTASLQKVTAGVANLTKTAGVTAGVGLASLSAALGLIAKRGLDFNLTVADASTALTQLLGSSSAATRFLGELQVEAAKSKPTLQELVPLAVQLVQAYGPAGLGKVLPTIRAFGDAAAIAAGGDTNRMGLALLGFRQLLNRGQAQQEEINQIGENLGVNVSGILKNAFGTADTETLAKAQVTGAQVADAIVAGLQRQFGGAQLRMAGTGPGLLSNIQDALDSITGRLTQGLGRSLNQAYTLVLGFLNKFQTSAAGSQIMDVLARGFTAVGDAVAYAATKLPALLAQVVPFLGSVAQGIASMIRFSATIIGSQENIRALMGGVANLTALIQTLFQTLFKVDFAKVFNPKSIISFFNAAWQGTQAFIRGIFAMGRVFGVVGRIIFSGLQNIGDMIRDIAKDAEFAFRLAFLEISHALTMTMADVITRFAGLADRLPAPVRKLIGLPSGGELRAASQSMQVPDVKSAVTLGMDVFNDQMMRAKRFGSRMGEDPARFQDPGTRIKNAFTNPDAFEQKFFADLQANAARIFSGLSGGMPGGVGPAPYVPELLFPGGGGGSSVTPVGPRFATPYAPQAPTPESFTADQLYQRQFGGGGAGTGSKQIIININGANRQQILSVIEQQLRELDAGPVF